MITILGHFQILGKLGEGGMGAVYKAHDTKLDRTVAIKVLPEDALSNDDRKRRFLQEARSASALNHTNIVTIHQIELDTTPQYIVMEYVDGQPLNELIPRTGMKLNEALRIALQIVDAVAVAHAARIVHRDLKPGNIMVTPKGQVKVLDFGLAKPLDDSRPDAGDATVTLNQPATEKGVILGSVPYMSPEQAQGLPVDERSDIFSFGSVLYEMLTGRRPFDGTNSVSTLSAILKDEPPPVSQFVAGAPPELEKIITRCLRKDPVRRFQHMDDLKVSLQDLKDEWESGVNSAVGSTAVPNVPRRTWLPAAGIAILLLVAAGGGLWWKLRPAATLPPAPLTRLTFDNGLTNQPAISRDGKLLAYVSDRAGDGVLNIWLQQLPGGNAVQLTHGKFPSSRPSISGDGSQVAYCGHGEEKGIYVIPTIGGEARRVAEEGHDPVFSPDGNWLAVTMSKGMGNGITLVPVGGGPSRPIAASFFHAASPVWSEDGKHLLFFGVVERPKDNPQEKYDWWVTAVEGASTPLRTGVLRELLRLGVADDRRWNVTASALAGNRAYFSAAEPSRSSNIWQVTLDPTSWKVSGAPRKITFGTGYQGHPSVSAAGLMVFHSTTQSSEFWSLKLDPKGVSVSGEPRQVTRNSGSDTYALVNADGTRLFYCATKGSNSDIWSADAITGKESTIVSTAADEHLAGLSLDGSWLLYFTVEKGNSSYWVVSTKGGAPEKLCDNCGASLSSSGGKVLYVDPADLILRLYDRSSKSRTDFAHIESMRLAFSRDSRFSPDDQWITLVRQVAPGESSLIVAPVSERKLDASSMIEIAGKGTRAHNANWSPDGSTLYYLARHDKYECIWGRRLDPRTKHPSGEPFVVRHFHSPNTFSKPIGFSVAAGQLIASIGEGSSNIWMTQVRD